ncbi:BMP family ABC transporter substrate-binding protein [Endozoicomonas sp. (ex Bugula neritina AB1)]|nr:BMP family ABC transporter substrate-binding protein [Endozoicomonas sp. (ex Bugula neritina AB1)]
MQIKKALAVLISAVVVSGSVSAYTFKPAIAYDKSGKADRSFNEAAFRDGVEKFEEKYGIDVFELEPVYKASLKRGIDDMAAAGYSPIVTIGFQTVDLIGWAAKKYPDIHFVTIDAVVNQPNVQSIVFKEHEGAFMVGALAAMSTETNTVGFIGGMDIPLIRKFDCGYAQGVKYINEDATVLRDMTGNTFAAFKNPEKGAQLALRQMSEGADVIFAAAGQTGRGVFNAVNLKQKKVIGVDSNQNWVYPGIVLTSMVKDVGSAAFTAWENAMNDQWQSGLIELGVKEGGVDWVIDEHNRSLITPEMEAKMAGMREDIISGKIVVQDYMADQSCSI